jgi:hypothetical protein
MKKSLQSILIFLISKAVFAQNPIDEMANMAAKSAFNKKVSSIYKSAVACKEMEVDPITGKTAKEWMEKKPEVPHWTMLAKMQDLAPKAREYANKKEGSDKVKHCFAGCFVERNSDLNAATMTGWLKELMDSSDCSPSTKFEESDYYATVAGAIASKKISECKDFCHREDVKKLTGEEMYQQAHLIK